MTPPTIHLNGTSRERLSEGFCEASQAVDLAYQTVRQIGPNGRDFYPQGPEALAAAELEHMSRLRRLDEIKKELDDLAMAVSEAP